MSVDNLKSFSINRELPHRSHFDTCLFRVVGQGCLSGLFEPRFLEQDNLNGLS